MPLPDDLPDEPFHQLLSGVLFWSLRETLSVSTARDDHCPCQPQESPNDVALHGFLPNTVLPTMALITSGIYLFLPPSPMHWLLVTETYLSLAVPSGLHIVGLSETLWSK